MRDTAASGFLIPASKFTELLPESVREQYTKAIEDQDAETVTNLLDEHAPEQFPNFESAFVFGDEDTSENLVKGEVYVNFDEEDIYKPKELNFAGEFLKAKDLLPAFERWTMFG